ncbi:MAG: hypothetical protein IKW46_07250 [Bacteroidaceae bacterium]|nr:hypothetical protein [Bacteroidaceae bacterium]
MNTVSRFTTLFLLVALTHFAAFAQKATVADREKLIELSLGNTEGVYSKELDFNEFFTGATITAKVKANKEGEATRINITKCRLSTLGNSDEKSFNSAKKLLKENCKNIIADKEWNRGKNSCRIIYKAGKTQKAKKTKICEDIQSIINAHITDEKRREIYGINGSAFINAKIDHEGKIYDTEYIGCIIWDTRWQTARRSNINSLHIAVGSNSITSIRLRPDYSSTEYKAVEKARKLLKNTAKSIGKELESKYFPTASKENICIEVNINGYDVDIEQSEPEYPDGYKALKNIYVEELNNDRTISRNNIKGYIDIYLKIKKSGKAIFYSANPEISSTNGKNSESKIIKEIIECLKKTTQKIPRWTPATFDGKEIEKIARLRIELK